MRSGSFQNDAWPWLERNLASVSGPEGEHLDDDYHLLIESLDDSSTTMIVEAPDLGCAQGSVFDDDIAHVRETLDQQFGDWFRRLRLGLLVTVIGVGFFDVIHGQEGVAPNGIELHPILDIRFGSAGDG